MEIILAGSSGGMKTIICFLKVQIKKSYCSIYVYCLIKNWTFSFYYPTPNMRAQEMEPCIFNGRGLNTQRIA